MKTTKLLLSVGIGLMTMTALTGCKDEMEVNEDWCLDETYKVPLKVNVNVDKTFSDYVEIDSTAMNGSQYRSTRGDPSWQLQYHVALYEKDKTVPTDVFTSFDNPVKVKARPGKYNFVGWATWSPPDGSKTHYFNLDDFNEIMLKQKYDYVANDSYKIPYRGAEMHSVAWTDDEMVLTARPAMAKFRLVATDRPQFTPMKTVVSYYSLPAAVNGLTGRINYAWSDIQFENQITDDELLASDYVLAHDEETEIFVKVEIYDNLGNMRARLSKLRVPVVNGGVTTIKGNFYSVLDLSGLSAGGISIDTEFEGTYEIEV